MRKQLAAIGLLLMATGLVEAEQYLTISDDGQPLQLVTPGLANDRRVNVVSLTGKWNKPPATGADHYVNFYFPASGYHYAHAVNGGEHEALFAQGRVKAMLVDAYLKRGCVSKGGTVIAYVSFMRPALTATEAHVISNQVSLTWPMYRPVHHDAAPVREPIAPPGDRPAAPRPVTPPPPKPDDGGEEKPKADAPPRPANG